MTKKALNSYNVSYNMKVEETLTQSYSHPPKTLVNPCGYFVTAIATILLIGALALAGYGYANAIPHYLLLGSFGSIVGTILLYISTSCCFHKIPPTIN